MSIKEKRFDQAGIMPYFFDERGLKIRAPLALKKALLSTFEGHVTSRPHPLPPVKILHQNQPHFLLLNVSDATRSWQGKWQLHLEDGAGILEGKVKKNSITLPRDLPLGYHDLVLHGGKEEVHCRLIVVMNRKHLPNRKISGAALFSFTL